MAKKGRKPKPMEERQTEVIALRVTPAEKAELLRGAGKRPLGTWARQLVFGRAVPVIPAVNRDVWQKTAGAANNLNQMARKINLGVDVDVEELRETIRAYRLAIIGLGDDWERVRNDSKNQSR